MSSVFLYLVCFVIDWMCLNISHLFMSVLYPYSGVKQGGDRQELHEAIRVHSMDAGAVVKGEGKSNDLLTRIAKDPLFKAVHEKLDTLVDPKLFIGRSKEQTEEFLEEEIKPVLEKEKSLLGKEVLDGVNV